MRGREDGSSGTDRWGRADWWGVVLDAPDVAELTTFWSSLLGWPVSGQDDDGAAMSPDDGGVAYLSIQREDQYVRPVWPAEPGEQQMSLHLDFQVSDLEAAVAHALELGAELPGFQPQDDVRVLLDPAGHPFCLYKG
jgi:catechol-2,3-dioxygenase